MILEEKSNVLTNSPEPVRGSCRKMKLIKLERMHVDHINCMDYERDVLVFAVTHAACLHRGTIPLNANL